MHLSILFLFLTLNSLISLFHLFFYSFIHHCKQIPICFDSFASRSISSVNLNMTEPKLNAKKHHLADLSRNDDIKCFHMIVVLLSNERILLKSFGRSCVVAQRVDL